LSRLGFNGSAFNRRNVSATAFTPLPPETTLASKLGFDDAASTRPVRTSTTTTAPAS
jgi:hypothetical protein